MFNPYITKLGNILPEITVIITDIYNQKSFWDKNPHYREISSPIFSYAIAGMEYPDGLLPDDEIRVIGKRLQENVQAFSKIDISKTDMSKPRSEYNFPLWARFIQNHIATDKQEQILDLLPDEIKQHKITFMIQIADIGQYILIHQDHYRSSGLFYLLTEPDSETRFYKPKEDFVMHNDVRAASIDEVELEHIEIIQKGTWYAFNHLAFHSVHALDETKHIHRASFVIEFVDLPYSNLVELAEQLNAKVIDTKV